ncbi:MAG: acetate/propionate family kinase [Planctomycetota bacterium]|nr:acetate/propionate family kinase [Planctomycetota bacterium]
MNILVANLGSTSFKYRLYRMPEAIELARGSIERIGSAESRSMVSIGEYRNEVVAGVADHAAAVRQCLAQLTDTDHGCLRQADEVAAIGFKAVHGGRLSGVQQIDEEVLEAMAEMNDVAPAHNPPYIAAMRQLSEQLPQIPLVAAFETGFHQTIPKANATYAIPEVWDRELNIRRFGFHGASHRFIAQRVAEKFNRGDLRVISCHLGGSSSLTAIRNGQSVATSMGASPQSGILQNNRVGDFDPFTLPLIMRQTGLTLEQVLKKLASEGGLLGISGKSGDVRDLEQAASEGEPAATLALDTFVADIRKYLGWMLVELGGTDVLVFTGGIGENSAAVRSAVCRDLTQLGIDLDENQNRNARGEVAIESDKSQSQIWVIPTNEEIVVASQVFSALNDKNTNIQEAN